MRTFAIGDVHGHLRLLVDILGQIRQAEADAPHRIVCLGDFIDRGPASAQVIGLLRDLQRKRGADNVICLRGNHEELLLRSRTDPEAARDWLEYGGGVECLASYGVASSRDIPREDIAWLEERPSSFEDEWRYYVHAGLDPSRDRLDQSDDDRLWIRNVFLDSEHDFGRYVVHGHTPQRSGRPDVRPFRVNLDTAAAYGGPLTCAIFEDGEAKPGGFLQALPV